MAKHPPETPETPPPATLQDFTTIVFNDSTITYDGEQHTITATGIPEGANVVYTNAGPFTNAGEYNITVKVTKENYNDFEKTAKLTINKLNFSGIVFESDSVLYDGNEHTIIATGYPQDATVTYTNAGPFTNIGEYNITVKITKDNYNDFEKTVKLNIIDKYTFTGISFEDTTVTYNGQEHTIVATGIPQGANIVYTNAGPFINAGEYDITLKVSMENYYDYEKTVTLTIEKADLQNITFDDKTVDYNGQPHTIIATGYPQGANVVYTNAGPFTNAGEYNITVKVTKENYNDFEKTVKLTINKLNFSGIVFESDSVFYDGNEHTIIATGYPQDASVTYTNAGPFTNIGEYNITVKITKDNYNDFEKTVKLNIIDKYTFTGISFENTTVTYNGHEHTIVATGIPQGANIVYTNAGPFINVGEYDITLRISMENYYDYEKTVTLTIEKADLQNITFDDKTVDYNGQPHTIIATGYPQGATVTYTNEGPFVDADSYNITVKIEMDNYNDFEKTATLTINKVNLQNVIFDDKTVDYNGQPQTITASNYPQDATVTYSNEGTCVNAGSYDITVNIISKNYNDFQKTVTLTINKINFTDITFENDAVNYDEEEHTIFATGYPQGAKVVYTNQGPFTEIGKYDITVKITMDNYNDFEKTVTLTIKQAANFAKTLIDSILKRPNAWEFMPDGFNKSNLAVENDPSIDFSQNFVQINSINQKFIGAQMYVLWDGVYNYENFLSYFDIVYAVGETIASVYQTFINNNPDEYACWSGEAAGFKVKLELDGSLSKLLVGNNLFSLELSVDSDANLYKGRIQLADNAIANYKMTDTSLLFNTSLMIKGVATIKQIQFVRNEDTVVGYYYQYTGAEAVALKTSAVFAFNEDISVVMSAKRESDDLLIEGYEEVYSSQTGKYLSGEVLENNKLVTYDTHWINLNDVTGINTIKAIKNQNDRNPSKNQHDIYINGSSDVFTPEYNKIAFVKTSRHYDIEMKNVYYVQRIVEEDDIRYEIVETQIPMLFIQEENIEDFADEVIKNNPIITQTPTLPLTYIETAKVNYDALKTLLDSIKENLTYSELINCLGTKDAFFNS